MRSSDIQLDRRDYMFEAHFSPLPAIWNNEINRQHEQMSEQTET